MLDELILAFFMGAVYQADDCERFDYSAELAHCALHVVAEYEARP